METACRVWKNFDVAWTFNKILENASKILHALQNDCSMEVLRKFFDAVCKKSMHFLCNIQKTFSQVFTITLKQTNSFWKPGDILVVLKNCSLKHTKNRDSFNTHLSNFSNTTGRADLHSMFQQCERQKMRNVPWMKNWIALWNFFVKFLDFAVKFFEFFVKFFMFY